MVLVEAGTLGQGASSRAAGMVRAQGGTPTAVRLGMFSRDFYAGQPAELGIDSGFVAAGLSHALLHRGRGRAGPRADRDAAGLRARRELARARTSSTRPTPTSRRGRTLGASYAAGDGYIDPPRNVLAYTAALFTAGVEVRERTAMTGLVIAAAAG